MSNEVLLGTVLLALALGGLCWIVCSFYTRLWNKHFRVKFQHHLICAVAAVLTITFIVQYRAVGNLAYIVDNIIDDWHEHLIDDYDFHRTTYATAFFTLKERFPSAFIGVPKPHEENSFIPFNTDEMMQICVEIYVNEACSNFLTAHPFLNLILKARPGVSEDDIKEDIRTFFLSNPGQRYPLVRAVSIAAKHIRENLLEQSPETVWKTRLILVLLFLVVQLVPFGIIGYFAYKDLKIGRHDYTNQIDNYSSSYL